MAPGRRQKRAKSIPSAAPSRPRSQTRSPDGSRGSLTEELRSAQGAIKADVALDSPADSFPNTSASISDAFEDSADERIEEPQHDGDIVWIASEPRRNMEEAGDSESKEVNVEESRFSSFVPLPHTVSTRHRSSKQNGNKVNVTIPRSQDGEKAMLKEEMKNLRIDLLSKKSENERLSRRVHLLTGLNNQLQESMAVKAVTTEIDNVSLLVVSSLVSEVVENEILEFFKERLDQANCSMDKKVSEVEAKAVADAEKAASEIKRLREMELKVNENASRMEELHSKLRGELSDKEMEISALRAKISYTKVKQIFGVSGNGSSLNLKSTREDGVVLDELSEPVVAVAADEEIEEERGVKRKNPEEETFDKTVEDVTVVEDHTAAIPDEPKHHVQSPLLPFNRRAVLPRRKRKRTVLVEQDEADVSSAIDTAFLSASGLAVPEPTPVKRSCHSLEFAEQEFMDEEEEEEKKVEGRAEASSENGSRRVTCALM